MEQHNDRPVRKMGLGREALTGTLPGSCCSDPGPGCSRAGDRHCLGKSAVKVGLFYRLLN